jgi:hypothetical protein
MPNYEITGFLYSKVIHLGYPNMGLQTFPGLGRMIKFKGFFEVFLRHFESGARLDDQGKKLDL